jgi:hypothetical protein
VELNNDLRDMSEGEDVFYTYRVSLSSSRGSQEGTPTHRSDTHTISYRVCISVKYILMLESVLNTVSISVFLALTAKEVDGRRLMTSAQERKTLRPPLTTGTRSVTQTDKGVIQYL